MAYATLQASAFALQMGSFNSFRLSFASISSFFVFWCLRATRGGDRVVVHLPLRRAASDVVRDTPKQQKAPPFPEGPFAGEPFLVWNSILVSRLRSRQSPPQY